MASELGLHIADYVIFMLIILMSVGIGIWFAFSGTGNKSTEEYFVGGRRMKYIPIALSLMVTYESSITTLGAPAEVYIYGISYFVVSIGFFFANALIPYITVPLARPLRLTSVFQYLQVRFNSTVVRNFGISLYLMSNLIYIGIVLFGPAIALEAVSGVSKWISMCIIAAAAGLYTTFGGIKSVIWTDAFQAIIMFTGTCAVIVKGTIDTGGPTEVYNRANRAGRLQLLDFNPDPTVRHTVWTLLFPSFIRAFNMTFNQSTIQRVSSAKSYRSAFIAAWIVAPLALFSYLLSIIEGVVVFSYQSQKDVEPLICGEIDNPNQIVPLTVLELFHESPGMSGLFLATLFSASLSTISSCLSSMSTLIMKDWILPHYKDMSDKKATILSKVSVACLSLLAITVSAVVTQIPGTLIQICASLMYATMGPIIGLFLLACFFPSSTSKGSLIGVSFGTVVCLMFSLGQNFAPGMRQTPWLPLGNKTLCPSAVMNGTITPSAIDLNDTGPVHGYNYTFTVPTNTSANTVDGNSSSGSLNCPFLNLSYNLTALIGASSTIIVGLISSFIFGKNQPGDVDPRYILEISESMLVWLPRRVKNWLKSIGPQYKVDKFSQQNDKLASKDDEDGAVPLKKTFKPDNFTNGHTLHENETAKLTG